MALLRTATLFVATLAMGLSAGLFATFSYSVMPGLGQADDRTFVTAFNRINVAILNAWFFAVFVGALVLTVLAAVLHLPAGARRVLPWIALALVLYLAVFVITRAVNIPLNDALLKADETRSAADLAAARAQFETTWVRWNIARTVASSGAFAFLAWALVVHGRLTAS
jgi:uncharacterized membrane protein